jgi:hypothetical protein
MLDELLGRSMRRTSEFCLGIMTFSETFDLIDKHRAQPS